MNQGLFNYALSLLGMTEAQLVHKYRMGNYAAEAVKLFGERF